MEYIKNTNNLYSITKDGKVFSYRSNKFIRPNVDKDGYYLYHIRIKGKRTVYKAHRLVAEYFIGDIKDKEINHINGNKKDNRVENLEIVDKITNLHHAKINKLIANGEKIKQSKLKKHEVLKIKELYKTGNYTYFELAKIYGVCFQNIGYIIKNKTWKD